MKSIRKKIIGIIIFCLVLCPFIPKIVKLLATKNMENKEIVFSSLADVSAPYAVIDTGNSSGGLSIGRPREGHAMQSTIEGIGDVENGGDTTEMYTYWSDTYCAGHGWCLTRLAKYEEGSLFIADDAYEDSKQVVDYKFNKERKMAQSIAYARWFGAKDPEMQDIVWASWQWAGANGDGVDSCLLNIDSSKALSTDLEDIRGRSYKFANFAYRGLNNGKLGLYDDSKEEPKVMIDQGAQTYTTGPYVVSFTNQNVGVLYGSGYIKDLVWKEITQNNPGKFCAGSISANIKFQDGTIANKSIQILDSEENPISGNFPRFGETFYVRYQSSINEEAVESIEPSIRLEYYQKFNGTCYTYQSKHIEYSMIKDNGGILETALRRKGRIMKTYSQAQYWIEREFSTFKDFPVEGQSTESIMRSLGQHVTDLTTDLRDEIIKLGADWGLSNVSPNLESFAGFWWENEFYEINAYNIPYIKISSVTGGGKYWTYSKEGESTVTITDPNDPRRSSLSDEGYDESEHHHNYVATAVIVNPLGSMSDFVTTGSDQDEAKAKQSAIDQMKAKVEDIYISVKITGLKINEDIEKVQPAVQFSDVTASIVSGAHYSGGSGSGSGGGSGSGSGGGGSSVATSGSFENVTFKSKEINMYIGGNVWQALPENKTGGYGNRQNGGSINLGGIQTEIWDINIASNTPISTTRTDSEGEYGFQKLHPLHKYKIVFTYDGMRFEDVEYNNNLSGGYSTAEESGGDRNSFNDLYDEIQSSPQNYYKDGQWRKAYRSIFKNRRDK